MHLEFYQSPTGLWHWRVVQVSNGQSVIAISGIGFSDAANAKKNWLGFCAWVKTTGSVPAPATATGA